MFAFCLWYEIDIEFMKKMFFFFGDLKPCMYGLSNRPTKMDHNFMYVCMYAKLGQNQETEAETETKQEPKLTIKCLMKDI